MTEIVSDAKQTLLRALDQITEAEERHGGEVNYLAVVYSVKIPPPEGETHGSTVRGWSTTDDPPWLTAALLHDVACAIDADEIAFDPSEDDDVDG